MKVLDKLSWLLGSRLQAAGKPQSQLLEPAEIRLILDARVENLINFAATPRLHAVDAKGDTPLHLAARTGNLLLCDFFISAGADPGAKNHESRTPAEVAFGEGHSVAAQLLSSLIAKPADRISDDMFDDIPDVETAPDEDGSMLEPFVEEAPSPIQTADPNDLDDLLTFEPEQEPQDFFGQSASVTASGTFVARGSQPPMVATNQEGDWKIDLSPAQISGEGIGFEVRSAPDQGEEHDFLKVRNRGRQSVKRAIVQSGTRLSIDPKICADRAEEILKRGSFTVDDIESLISLCEGNGDPEELRINLKRNLEAAGLELIDLSIEDGVRLWDAGSDVSCDELAEAIGAVFSRATRLPGTRRFIIDKSNEAQLLEPMVRASQELQLGILACEAAIDIILDIVDRLLDGRTDPASVTLRSIIPARPGHIETAEFIAAADALKLWQVNGRVMDGKRRREALEALAALDLSLAFHKEIVKSLERLEANLTDASRLDRLISTLEIATERLILEHLPYARRFAARNAEDEEDSEEVFQVAFMGLQRSIRRFDPERGIRFVIYCTFWMNQTLVRWRADEAALIRVPVHRHEKLAKLDRAMGNLGVMADGAVSDRDLAIELGWTRDEVRQFRNIPRQAEYPEGIDAWDALLPELRTEDFVDEAETERIVEDLLADLPERQADVIRMRFGIGRSEEMTLEEVGQIYGVTRERIRQIESKGLAFLSHPARKRRLQTMLGI
ncbi:sigma-70 family RNA polymerase sigma factor [Rhizobium sp. NLR4a]|uniref:sigma-70 family RNA polymerase sigma factor n=1 Tax=Rhizobium sp. NLR4a TaxID=2731117 RepID=UPI001C835463|nr:sigma-70 family RNA polymerase sigma factor [Rhizobium sp. NLR4a]MBX5236649.1 sigma-70 family RNA polymerase sigma factor [Rhizobium sp. NLR4a]